MRISQFQKYSQKENTVTNNVLLMLSRLNDIKTEYYKDLIRMITDVEDYFPSPIFEQQIRIQGGIIDGYIEMRASKIVIETKLSSKELIEKLTKYAITFSAHSQNFLWHISTEKYNPKEMKDIESKLSKRYPKIAIHFSNLTFSDVVENLEGIYELNKHDTTLKLLFEDFNDYCNEEGLISDSQLKLIFVPASYTLDWNLKHKIYFCPLNWHKQDFKYFGLYNNKSIRTLATVENCIAVNFDKTSSELKIQKHRSTMDKEITEEQKKRLRNGLIELGWKEEDLEYLKYYLFDKNDFYETDFCKRSKGGIRGARYMNLKDFLKDKQKKWSTEEIADFLKGKEWD